MLETALALAGLFIVYILRKTDVKIDKTSSDLTAYKLEVATAHSLMRADVSRDFATKLELQETEKRLTETNREIQRKLDRLIDRLIDNPH